MRPVALTIAALAMAALGIALACGSNPIIVATIDADASSIPCEISDAGDSGETCGTGFCAPTSCGGRSGTCEPARSDGCAASEIECGCDGITYFNRCLREAAHVGRAATGECDPTFAVSCSPTKACTVKGASCATIVPTAAVNLNLPDGAPYGLPDGGMMLSIDQLDTCRKVQSSFGRFCWVLPDECPEAGPGSVFTCDLKCIEECAAIRSGGIYFTCPSADASATN